MTLYYLFFIMMVYHSKNNFYFKNRTDKIYAQIIKNVLRNSELF